MSVWKVMAVVAATALVLSACGGKKGGSEDCAPTGGSQATATQTVKLVPDPNTVGRFDPKEVTVKVGESVLFTWEDADALHTVTAQDKSFDSGLCGKGNQFTVTFSKAGSVPYRCTIHAQMLGTVKVS